MFLWVIFDIEQSETGYQIYAVGALKEKKDEIPHQKEALLKTALINLYKL